MRTATLLLIALSLLATATTFGCTAPDQRQPPPEQPNYCMLSWDLVCQILVTPTGRYSDAQHDLIRQLHYCKNPKVADALLVVLNRLADPHKNDATEALGYFQDPRAVAPIAKGVEDGTVSAYTAMQAFSFIGTPEAIQLMVRMMQENPDAGIRRDAAEQMHHLPMALMPIADLEEAAAKDPSPYVRATAIGCLVHAGRQEYWPAMEKAVRDPDVDVRREAAVALCFYMELTDRSIELVLALLADKEEQVRAIPSESLEKQLNDGSIDREFPSGYPRSAEEGRRAAEIYRRLWQEAKRHK